MHKDEFKIEDEIELFMCQTDYDWHLYDDIDGTTLYPSEKSLRQNRTCVDECGIVAVKVVFSRIVAEGNGYDKRI